MKSANAMQKSQHGFALVIVIWVLTLLCLMAGSFALTMRRANGVTMALKNNAQAVALTESSLTMTKYMLQQPDPLQAWQANGSVYRIVRNDGSEIRIRIESESGKIDINNADPSLLAAAIDMVTADKWQQQKLLNSILDWRDADDEARPQSAEKKQYLEAGLNYAPSNMPFQSLEELQLVMGFDAAIYERMRPWLTIYSGQTSVDLTQALPEVQVIVENAQLSGNAQASGSASTSAPKNPAQNNTQPASNSTSTYTIIIEAMSLDGGSASLEAVTQLSTSAGGPPPGGLGQAPPANGQPSTPGQGPAPGQQASAAQSSSTILDWKQNQLKKSLFAIDMEAPLITVHDEFTNYN
jgi:general secretion pathway protein K